MLTYLVKRLMVSIVVLLGIALGTFLIIHLIPGDPAKIQLGVHATPAAVEHLHEEVGPRQVLAGAVLALPRRTSSPSTSATRPPSAPASPN